MSEEKERADKSLKEKSQSDNLNDKVLFKFPSFSFLIDLSIKQNKIFTNLSLSMKKTISE